MNQIIIVYYIFINPKRDWKKIVKGQLGDLLISGLVQSAKLHIHITDTTDLYIDECKTFIRTLLCTAISWTIQFRSNTINQFEYPGFIWLYELAQENPNSSMLYLHTKGMVYHHSNERDMCEKTILRYTIRNWLQTMQIFEENKMIHKIGVYPSTEGWIWFNIFWVRSDYLINSNPPEYKPDNRYYYESYIGREAPKVNKGYGDCYSLVNKQVHSYSQPMLFDLIYDNSIYNYDMQRLPGGKEVNIHFNKQWYSFFYGPHGKKIDITKFVYSKCELNGIVFIPSDDIKRAELFGDPEWGTHKYIFIKDIFGNETEYTPISSIYIDLYHNKIYTIDDIPEHVKNNNIHGKLKDIHSKLKIKYVDFTTHEYPEQCMSVRYIKGHEKVLEIGANVGRNSLILSYLLDDSRNLVSLECDYLTYQRLLENKELNNFNCKCINAALSARQLIQKDWDTIPSDVLLEGYTRVNTITLPELKEMCDINFDTLVLDCEGAFYYILLDYPEILNGVNLIIMENDYHEYSHKEYIDTTLKHNGFNVDYSEPGGWGPCENNFYEVWTR